MERDKELLNELSKVKRRININIPLKYNQLKRYLLYYSLRYDWAFIRKLKNIENYLTKNNINENDEDIEIYENNNELGIDYFNNLDNIEDINTNDHNNNEFGLNYFNNFNNNKM